MVGYFTIDLLLDSFPPRGPNPRTNVVMIETTQTIYTSMKVRLRWRRLHHLHTPGMFLDRAEGVERHT